MKTQTTVRSFAAWVLIALMAFPLNSMSATVVQDFIDILIRSQQVILAGKESLAREAARDVKIANPFLNASVRSLVTTEPLVLGFVVGGAGSNTKAKYLIRAVGPALRNFGITNAMADPLIQVYKRTPTAEVFLDGNNDWWDIPNDAAAMRNHMSKVGAFPLPDRSDDAAIYLELDPGDYTCEVRGWNSSQGIVLLEIYVVPQSPF